ncbi:hypothetical protein HBI23_129180 [Parastagonospora nodorum]|nr:hypothetical protein HBI12_071840 [Parastagonospora nodorum]KAH5442407.1 hypothetical protein HBI47_028690 [Parastagonospora nodorum]KAH5660117.1 hypothetical protein HBI23_129180 [Parastagonospora nodorum]
MFVFYCIYFFPCHGRPRYQCSIFFFCSIPHGRPVCGSILWGSKVEKDLLSSFLLNILRGAFMDQSIFIGVLKQDEKAARPGRRVKSIEKERKEARRQLLYSHITCV